MYVPKIVTLLKQFYFVSVENINRLRTLFYSSTNFNKISFLLDQSNIERLLFLKNVSKSSFIIEKTSSKFEYASEIF